MEKFKSGFVSIIGRTNVGKSTLINSLLGEKVAITANKSQTTRTVIKAIINNKNSQIIFTDTPGIHKPHTKLNETMIETSFGVIKDIDLILFVIEATSDEIGRGDMRILEKIKESKKKAILIINKIDLQDSYIEIKEEYSKEIEVNKNKYTGKYKDNNLIMIQLEGLDSWLVNKNDTPTIYNLMKNSINFTNHYSYYNGGGSTFNSEFAVNTGFITPLSYTQNAYTFNKNSFPYSLAHLFKEQGYTVNAFHMNTKEYYSRGTNYKNWGYDNYYGLVDQNTYKDNSYYLDRELLLNEEFKEKMFSSEKFVDYIITYTNHMPFNPEKGNCKMLLDLDSKDAENTSYDLTEEDCARRQAKETDYMMELLLNELKTRNLYNNTTIVVLTDHYLYTLSDKTILDKYKKNYKRDIFQGNTVDGIHKDDLKIFLDENDAGMFASQGQQRSIILSIKIALVEIVKMQIGEYPVLLLDDVLSELDEERKMKLLNLIDHKVQTFITTTHFDLGYHHSLDDALVLRIEKGTLKEDK